MRNKISSNKTEEVISYITISILDFKNETKLDFINGSLKTSKFFISSNDHHNM